MRASLTCFASLPIALVVAAAPAAAHELQKPDLSGCTTSVVTLDTNFPAGNVSGCETSGKKRLKLKFAPEDAPPINCSAWYAFRLTPKRKTKVTVTLDYEACGHRYWPKVSTDGQSWKYLPKKQVKVTEEDGKKSAKIKIKLGKQPVFVAAQEIFAPSTYDAWLDVAEANPDAIRSILGKSTEGREIPMLSIALASAKPKEQVVLVGRQHPPEITGALGMMPFVETILSDNPIAVQYRARFETIVVPMLNPDGVVRGHWRHNVGGTDLNRDWGPFKQAETKLMDGLLQKLESDPAKKLRFFADFHSTQNDIFYTIPDEFETTPKLYIKNWLGRLQERMPDYKVKRNENPKLTQANSKNYVYRQYRVPTVTYEMGDETDRALIAQIGKEAALAMMETLLKTDPAD